MKLSFGILSASALISGLANASAVPAYRHPLERGPHFYPREADGVAATGTGIAPSGTGTGVTTGTAPPGPICSKGAGCGRDCGTFKLACERAEGACNNACYAINCINTAYSTFTYVGPTTVPRNRNEANRNREQSGANVSGGTGKPVCGAVPFSQKVRDPAAEALGLDPVTAALDSDEFPMASSQQDDFQEGTIRNALRCIPDGDNRRSGRRVGDFINNRGPGRAGKTCEGRLRRDDHFVFDFDFTGADTSKLQYCIPDSNTQQIDCSNDGFQFHLSELPTDTGRFDFPYDNVTDNHYQITRLPSDDNNTPADILQCSVQVDRTGNDDFSAEIFDVDGNSQGTQDATLEDALDQFSVDGLPYPVTIQKTGNIGSEVRFTFEPASGGTPDPVFGSFTWNTDSKGFSDDISGDGSYCQVGDVASKKQSTKCYFPCYAFSLGEQDQ